MSGLAVQFRRDGRPADETAISAMLAAVPHRGIDGTWTHRDGAVALGYAKLAITPEEEDEVQPLVSPRTGCVLIADARLDNRAALLASLPSRLEPTVSDATLILYAYETWGVEAAARLLGDFAFVVWDPRHQRLVAARDTSAQRTLYYRVDQQTFAAASEVHQLLQDPAVPVAPNEEHIRQFLVLYNIVQPARDRASTFYEGISALPAGHTLVVDRGHLRMRRYWELAAPSELRYRTDGEYAEHYLALFSEVVRARLRSSRPVGATLSGGLDSSSVACTAQELYRAGRAEDRGFTTFSNVYDGLECDERDYIADVQAKYGFTAQYIPSVGRATWLQLEPVGFRESPLSRNTEFEAVLGAASGAGVRALLTGNNADAIVAGSPLVFDSLIRQGRLGALWHRLRRYRGASDEALLKILALYCLAPLLPLPLQKQIMQAYVGRFLRRNWHRLLPAWIGGQLREDLSRRHLQLSLEREGGRLFANPGRQHEYNMLYPRPFTHSCAPWPVVLATPFADRRLHEFLLAVPPEQKYAPHPDTDVFYAGSKRLVRRAMRGILPESLRTRTEKITFNAVFEAELERKWPLYEATFGPRGTPRVAARGYVDQGAFWARLEAMRAGARKNDFVYVMRTVALESWLRGIEQPRSRLVVVPPPAQASASGTDLLRREVVSMGSLAEA